MRPARLSRAVAASAVAASVVLGLTACGGDEESTGGLPSFGSSTSSSPSPSASATTDTGGSTTATSGSAYPDAVPTVTEGNHRAGPSADPLVEAVVGYERALLTSLHEGATADDLGAVADGPVVGDVVATVRDWKSKGWTLRGSLVVAVNEASVSGSTASVTGCLKDSTVAFKGGRSVQAPKTTYFTYTAKLTTRGSSWVVNELTTQSRGTCAV